MRYVKLSFLFLVFMAVGGDVASAQEAVSAEKLALIREYLQVAGGSKSANERTDMMLSFQEAESAKMAASMIEMDDKLSPSDKAAAKKMTVEISQRTMKRTREFFSKEVDMEKMVEEIIIPIYDKHFSETELRDLIAFYKTPTGRKSTELMPELMKATMTSFSEKLTPKLQEFFKRMAEEEYAVVRKELLDAAKKPSPKRKRA